MLRITIKEAEVGAKKDVNRSVRMSEDDEAIFVQMAGKLDVSVSELIREAAKWGLPTIIATPSLLGRIDLDDMNKNMFG